MSEKLVASPLAVVVEAALTVVARRRRMPLTGRDLAVLARAAVEALPLPPVPVVERGRRPGASWTWKPRTGPGAAREVARRLEASFAGPWPPVGRQSRDETTEPAGPH